MKQNTTWPTDSTSHPVVMGKLHAKKSPTPPHRTPKNLACFETSEDSFGELIFVGTGMFGFFIVVYQVYRCIVGVPNAQRSPEATTEQFFLDAFDFTLSEGFESYLCLLNKAKGEFIDLSDFKQYWKDTRNCVFEQSKKLFTGFNNLNRKVENIEVYEKTDNTARCSIILKLKMILEYPTVGQVQRDHRGNVYLNADISLIKISDRWYLTSGKWNGMFKGTALRNTISVDLEKNEKDAPVADLKLSGKPLHKAIAEADTQKIEKLISKGINVDRVNRKKVSPIHVAAYYANLQVINLLLDKGANPNVMTVDGHTVLAYAFFGFEYRSSSTREELMSVIEILVEGGADVNLKNPHGSTVIYIASLLGYTPIIEFLLDHGANVNTIAEGGVTPLIAAMLQLNSEAMELLLSRGADTTLRADDGRSIFKIAKDRSIGPALIQLLKKYNDQSIAQ